MRFRDAKWFRWLTIIAVSALLALIVLSLWRLFMTTRGGETVAVVVFILLMTGSWLMRLK